MATLNDPLPPIILPAVDAAALDLSACAGQIVVVYFWSTECPWSQAADTWLNTQVAHWQAAGVTLVALAANASDDEEAVRAARAEHGLAFTLYRDPGGALTHALGATHTPHVFVFDRAGRLAYQGAFDDRTFRKRKAEINYLENAIAALLAGRRPEPAETQPYGCTLVFEI